MEASRSLRDPRDDHALMAAIANGDQSALEQLYERFSPMVYALCRRVLRDPNVADELLADIFMEVWRKSERFDASRGSVVTYLATLTRSRAIDRLRSQRRTAAAPLSEIAEPEASPSDPASALGDAEQRARVASALALLSPDQRAAIDLAYFSGLTQSQIAQRLNKPLGTVKTHIRQGLIQLRDVLRISSGDGPGTDPGRRKSASTSDEVTP